MKKEKLGLLGLLAYGAAASIMMWCFFCSSAAYGFSLRWTPWYYIPWIPLPIPPMPIPEW